MELVEQIKELAELRLNGVLDEREFTAAKAKLLSADDAPRQDIGDVESLSAASVPLVIAAETSPIAAMRTEQVAAISAAHTVKHFAVLREFLVEKELDDLVADLDAVSDQDTVPGQWYAEHARSQLNPDSGCESKPAWVARLFSVASGSSDHESVDDSSCLTQLALWASDEKAVRRALLALQLEREGRSVEIGAWGLPKAAYTAQVQRWAYEHEGYEMVLPTGSASSISVCGFVATLRAARGRAFDALQRERAANANADIEHAKCVLDQLSSRLLATDPQCMIKVARGTTRPGTWVIEQLRYKGHVMDLVVEVDKHASIDALEKLATTSCLCCAGDDSPWPQPVRRSARLV